MPAPDIFGVPTVVLSAIGDVEIDAVLSQEHRFRAQVSENPVEDGSILSDHIVNLPVVLELEGRLTDTPLTTESLAAGALGGAATALTGNAGFAAAGAIASAATQIATGVTPGKAKDKFQQLVALQDSREPFTVVTGLNVYEGMVFEALSFPKSSRDGRSIRFTATLRELLVAGEDSLTVRERIAAELQHSGLPVDAQGFMPKTPFTP